MVDIWPFCGTRPYNQDAKTLIAPSTDHLSIENIEIFRKNNYWNYLKILNPVGQLKEKDQEEERAVAVMASYMTQILRDNPHLVKWITKNLPRNG